MKILYLHQYFKTPKMNGGTRSYEFAKRLVSWGHEVHMVTSWTSDSSEKDWFITNEDGIIVHWLPVRYDNRMGFFKRIKAFIHFAARSTSRSKRIGADIVFATSTPLTIALPGIFASRILRVPMVFEVRDLWPEMPIAMGILKNPVLKFLAHRLERLAYKKSEHVIALSPGMEIGVKKVSPNTKVTVIPNSCDIESFSSTDVSANDFIDSHPELKGSHLVVYSGTFGAVNGLEYLVEVAAESKKMGSNVKYVAVGDGAMLDKITQKSVDLNVKDDTFFIYPPIPKENVPSLLRSTSLSLSLFINLKEMQSNSANKFFDALAAGNPIAINYGGWHSDLITEKNLGINLAPNDPKSAAQSIIDFLKDPKRIETCSKNSLETAKKHFDREKLAKKLEVILQETVNP